AVIDYPYRGMSRAQAESVIKNIIREIAQQCASKGQSVSETLTAFMLEHPHTVPADGAVGVEVERHQVFWTCDNRTFISVLTTVPPHTDSLGVSTKTKAGLVTEDDPLPFLSCVVQPSADGAAPTGGLMEDTTARWMSVMVAAGSVLWVKAVVLDPRNLFNVDRTLTKQDVQKLIELCVDRLLDQRSPTLDTIKMQVHFDMNYTSRREFVEEHQRVLQARLLPVCREITDSRAKSREDLETLYRKIVSYVILRSGLGSATDITTVREATAALQSVFPQTELATFMSLLKRDKEQQLNELTLIITGIQLFNKDSGKGGEDIEDLPAILNETLPAASREIESELEGTQRLAWRYTALLESFTDCPVHPDLLRQALYNVRQHEAFLKLILADVVLCAKQVEVLQTELTARMRILKATVHSKTAVPTSQVFPHFTALAKLWAGLQDEMLLLSMLSNMVASLRPFLSAQSRLMPAGLLEQLLEGVTVKTDLERVAENAEERVDPAEMKACEWFLPETTANFDNLPLQYRGACGHTLIKRSGLLLPGNPSIGVLKHKERYYSFSSRQAAYEFASKADEYIGLVAETAKKSPELIQLLELHQQFASVTPYSQVALLTRPLTVIVMVHTLRVYRPALQDPHRTTTEQMQSGERLLVKPITKSDSCTQTDTHILESNIVKSYEWNEWELRRKAIKLANLRSKVTRSMQTNLSHMRRHNSTQTFLPRDASCQTKRDVCECRKMAEASISVDQHQFVCPVCLDLLKDPVTIQCGHSYCMVCINRHWDQDDQWRAYSCPQCRETFTPRPDLRRNNMLAEVVERVKKMELQAASLAHCYAGPGDVECDFCTGRKLKAIRSCLVCLASYCETHVLSHYQSPAFEKHQLVEASTRLQEKICSQHGKVIDIYCRTDQSYVCYLCTMHEHKGHDTFAAVAERAERQSELEEIKRRSQQRLRKKEKRLREVKQTVITLKSSAQAAVEDSERIFTELIRSIERKRSEVIKLIRDQERTQLGQTEELLEELEQEIGELKRRNTELEELEHTEDHIHFLQSFPSQSVSSGGEHSARITLLQHLSFDGVRRSITGLKEQLEEFCKEELSKFSPHVHHKLSLSEKNRVVTFRGGQQRYSDHPERFDCCRQVLCRESVSGRSYWEVEWSRELLGVVTISVSYKGISRDGDGNLCKFGHNAQSWSLRCSPFSLSFHHNNIQTKLSGPSSSRVGVYVDHSAGTLSFYSVSDTMTLLHKVHTTFTQPLYAGFGVLSVLKNSFCECRKMAEASISVDQHQFICPVCLDLLKDPVTIHCGHSYCMVCINRHWDEDDQTGVYSCPQCRETFTPRPDLRRNNMLAEVVERIRKPELQAAASPAHCYAGPGDVECDFCTGRKLKAIKSCLACVASLCEAHLKPHLEIPALIKHKLVEASTRLQEKICSQHDKLMEIYCRTDQSCVCYLCTMHEHKGHDTVAAAAERAGKQLEHPHTVPADGAVGVEVEGHQAFWTCNNRPFILVLTTVPPHTVLRGAAVCRWCCTNRMTHGGHHCSLDVCDGGCWVSQSELEELQRRSQERLQEKEKELQEVKQTLNTIKSSAQTAVKDSERIFTELIRSFERKRSEVIKLIRVQERNQLSQTEGLLRQLEQEMDELKRRNAELEQLEHTEDPIHFIQCVQSLSVSSGREDSPGNTAHPHPPFDGVRNSLSDLKERLEAFCQEELRKIFPHEFLFRRLCASSDPPYKILEASASRGCYIPRPPPSQLDLPQLAAAASLTFTGLTSTAMLCPTTPVCLPAEVAQVTSLAAHHSVEPCTAAVQKPLPSEPNTREAFLQYYCALTLDPNTAHPSLSLSEQNRAVKHEGGRQSYSSPPESFDHWKQVLSKESLSGRCYWEVEWRREGPAIVNESSFMSVSVSYNGISRKGKGDECRFGRNAQSWSLECSHTLTFHHNSIQTELPAPSPSRVGVYVDHSAGTLSFYSVSDTMTLLHTVHTTFTQTLYAGFEPALCGCCSVCLIKDMNSTTVLGCRRSAVLGNPPCQTSRYGAVEVPNGVL
ncbi:hypothetical protein NFI96_030944, partial [Prochilodus magdalenae]